MVLDFVKSNEKSIECIIVSTGAQKCTSSEFP